MNKFQSDYSPTTKYLLIGIIVLLLLTILSSGCFASGFAVGKNVFDKQPEMQPIAPADVPPGEDVQSVSEPDNFEIFWDTMELLKDNYDGDVPEGRDVTFAAIQGLLDHIESCNDDSSEAEGKIIQITGAKMPENAPDNFDFFWTTVNRLYRDCPGVMPEPDELVYWAANGVIDRLGDRYTMLLPPKVAEDFRMDMERRALALWSSPRTRIRALACAWCIPSRALPRTRRACAREMKSSRSMGRTSPR